MKPSGALKARIFIRAFLNEPVRTESFHSDGPPGQRVLQWRSFFARLPNHLWGVPSEAMEEKSNIEHVSGLLRKKYTVEEVELMIKYKCFEWVGNKTMEKHLKPITLFKRHGEDYIQEAIEAKENPLFLQMIQQSIEADKKEGPKLATAGSITMQAVETLAGW